MPLEQVPGPRVELGVGVADEQQAGVDGRLEQLAEGERGIEAGVEAEAGGGLRDDEVGRQQHVACVAERLVVIPDPLVRAIPPPQEGDERAGVRVNDPQAARSLGAP